MVDDDPQIGHFLRQPIRKRENLQAADQVQRQIMVSQQFQIL